MHPTLSHSSGAVEGKVNRIKMIKRRRRDGRGDFGLLLVGGFDAGEPDIPLAVMSRSCRYSRGVRRETEAAVRPPAVVSRRRVLEAAAAVLGVGGAGVAGCGSGGSAGGAGRIRWQEPFTAPVSEDLAPMTVTWSGNMLYASHNRRLYALNPTDGLSRWVSDRGFDGEVSWYAPVVSQGVVCTLQQPSGARPAVLHALDAATGRSMWQFTGRKVGFGPTRPPVLGRGTVYYSATEATYALDLSTGRQLWSIGSTRLANLDFALSTPTVSGGLVYLYGAATATTVDRYTAANLAAVDAVTGQIRWIVPEQALATRPGALTPMAAAEGMLLVAGLSAVTGLDAATGRVRWTTAVTGAVDLPLATAAGTAVALSSGQGTATAIDVNSGRKIWTAAVPVTEIKGPPVINGTTVYIAGRGGLCALDLATGRQRWRLDIGETVWGPAVGGRTVYAFAAARKPNSRLDLEDRLYAIVA